jgi:RsiW-degrading membrane proteinase PrsW (M82 family)
MVGLGFAMTENIQYYSRAVTEAGEANRCFIHEEVSAILIPCFKSD